MMSFVRTTIAVLAATAITTVTASPIDPNSHITTRDASSYQQNARAAADQLMTLYDSSKGIWHDGTTTLWWNSASILTAMIDLFKIDSTVQTKYGSIIANTFSKAPAANPHATRKRSMNGLYTKEYTSRSDEEIARRLSRRAGNGQGFLNGYYDDEGWWAMAWINAYDLTSNTDYLQTAQQIWTDMSGGATTPCGTGGIWWDRKKSYIASIANELFLATSAALALRSTTSADKQKYTSAAIASLNFIKSQGLLTSSNLILDGLNITTCKPTGTTFTYNQGVILGGLVDLSQSTNDPQYATLAVQIANAAIASTSPLITNGILHEPNNCEKKNTCGVDGDQFKGVFVRNLRKLQQAKPNAAYKSFSAANAQSIWNNDRTGTATLGPNWAGPYGGDGKAPAQCSALECISAAEATQ